MLSEDVRTLLNRAGIRTNASRYRQELEVFVDRPTAKFAAWYEMFPRSQSGDPHRHGTFDDVIARLPYVAGHGLRCAVLHADPPDRQDQPQGPQQYARRPGRTTRAAPMPSAASEGGHDAIHPELGTFDDFHRLVEAAHAPRPRDRARFRDPVRAGPPVDQGAPRVVRLAAGRHDQVRREPAQEVRGHRQRPLLPRRPAGDLVRPARPRAVLDRPRRQDLPGRQPAHQAGAVLGMDDPGRPGPSPRRHLPVGGVHPAQDDEAAGQGRASRRATRISPGATPSRS